MKAYGDPTERAVNARSACNGQHVWTVRDENSGGQSVWCMHCMVPMDVRRLLQVYVDKHGGQIR